MLFDTRLIREVDLMENNCRLYLITPESLDPVGFAAYLSQALDAGDVGCVQLRLKGKTREQIIRAIDILRPIAQARDVAFLVNDDPGLAAQTGCDGVHVGQDDAKCTEARQIVGDDAIVGVTCLDSRHLAMTAADQGADYVAFGAFYPTATKVSRGHPSPQILGNWSLFTTVPCVAIGGITPSNCAPLVRSGADFLAVVAAVWDHPAGPGAAVKAFNQAIERAHG